MYENMKIIDIIIIAIGVICTIFATLACIDILALRFMGRQVIGILSLTGYNFELYVIIGAGSGFFTWAGLLRSAWEDAKEREKSMDEQLIDYIINHVENRKSK